MNMFLDKGRRLRLAREAVRTNDHRVLELMALEWEDKALPVLSMEGEIVGILEDIEREADGWVTGLVRVEEDFDLEGLAAQLDAMISEFEFDDFDGTTYIHKAKIYAVTMGDRPCWNGMEVVSA